MLPAYLFLSFQVASVSAGSQFTLPQSSLVFAPGWISSTTTASKGFLFTDKLGQALTVNLPETTSSLNYVGLKRTGGSIYGVCVDCASGTTTNLHLFSGHDSTLLNNADAEPVGYISVDPAQEHVLQIMNIADNSFGGKSELTFVSIVVDVQSSSTSTSASSVTASTSSATSSASSSTFTTSIASATSSVSMILSTSASSAISSASNMPSASASATAVPASGSTGNQTRNSLIIIIILLALTAVLSLAAGLFFYYRRERRRIPTLVDLDRIEDPPTMKEATVTPFSDIPSDFLAMAGRKKPPVRLLESYNYQRNNAPQGGPIFPVRRLERG